jgi:polyhydroxyalkanoate synthesis repressor PhaR
MARKKRAPGEPIIIKKYANRRLYNTETSSYVTLDHLAAMIKAGDDFQVLDAKSNDDLTRTVLTQIIFERETRDENMLPISFLRQLIKFYGDSMQSMVPAYLQSTMEILNKHRDQLGTAFGSTDNGNFMPLFEEMTRQNVAFFEQSMQMFAQTTQNNPANTPAAPNDQAAQDGSEKEKIDALQTQLAALKRQVDSLSD